MAVQASVLLRRAGRVGRGDRLAAEHHGQTDFLGIAGRAVMLAKAVAQLGQQRVMGGAGQVVNIDLMSEPFAAGCTHSNKKGPGAQGPGRHVGLGIDLITGINHRVYPIGQQGRPVIGVNELFNAMDLAGRVEGVDAFPHGKHLGLSNGRVQRLNLAVDVGFTHVVKVDQRQLGNAAACQCFSSPRANTTYTDHGNMRAGNAVGTSFAIQPGQAGKAEVHAQANRSKRQTW